MESGSFSAVLGGLDPVSRALLDLSLRRGLRPEEIAGVLGTDEDSVVEAREQALVSVADELGIEGEDRLDQVRALLAELPAGDWSGVGPPVSTDDDPGDPGEDLDAMATAGPDSALFEEAEYELETDRVLEEAEELEQDRLEPPPEFVPREELAKAEDEGDDEPEEEPEPDVEPEPEVERDPDPQPHPVAEKPARERTRAPAPKRAQKRRSRMPVLLGLLAALIAVGVLLALLAGGDDDPDPTPTNAATDSAPAAEQREAPAAEAGASTRLRPVGDAAARARGTVQLTGGGNTLRVSVRGLPSPGEGSYTVWLYNSVIEARRIGSGRDELSVNAKLPAKIDRYRSIDVSFEPADSNPNHSGRSVMRVPTAELKKK